MWYNKSYVHKRVRLLAAGILTFNHFFALSQAAALTRSERPEEPGFSLIAFTGLRGPVNAQRLDRFFDQNPARKSLPAAVGIPAAGIRAPARLPLKLRTLKHTRHPLVVPSPKATRAYRRTFRVLRNNPALTDRYDELILKYAGQFKLDPRLLKAIIAAESEFNRHAVSPAGARGLMQLMPRTAEEMGVARKALGEPESNIQAGARYIAHLFKRAWRKFKLKGLRYQDAPTWVVQRIIAAYNAGPRFLYRTDWYRQTRRYVRKVLLFYQSKVTDIRRLPEMESTLPVFQTTRSSTGFYN